MPTQKKTWEILGGAIPRGEAERIAKLMRVSVDTVRKWCREPEGDDNTASGRFNPLEEILLLIDSLRARKLDEGIYEIVEFINNEAIGEGTQKPAAEAEKELRAAARRCEEAADLLAGKTPHGERQRIRGESPNRKQDRNPAG